MHRLFRLNVQQSGLLRVAGSVCTKSTTVVPHDTGDASKPADGVDQSFVQPYSAIPGPKPVPIFGNLWRFLPGGEFHKKPISEFFEIIAGYGEIAKLSGIIGRPDMVVLSDPKDLEQVFRNEGPWPVRQGANSLQYYFQNVRKGLPNALATSQGKEWQEFRTAVNQVMMQPRNTKQYVQPIDSVSQEFIARMREIRSDSLNMPPDFSNEFSKWALESITLVALDTKLGLLRKLEADSEGAKMIKAVHVVFDSIIDLDFKPSPWKLISTPAYRRFIKAMDFFTEVSTKYVNVAMDRLQQVKNTEIENRPYSVLENLLLKQENPQIAVTMALDMLLAGVDTTGTVAATVAYQMAIHPDKQRLLQVELDRVIVDPNEPLTKQQLEDMKYLRACIKETMRVMPILPGTSRTLVKDLTLKGFQIPKGTMIMANTATLGKKEQHFPRPDEFLPERWLPGGEELKCRQPFAFLPFGFGPRMCVGKRFADLELETLTARIFRSFTLEWNKPPPKTDLTGFLRFEDPLTFTVRDRT